MDEVVGSNSQHRHPPFTSPSPAHLPSEAIALTRHVVENDVGQQLHGLLLWCETSPGGRRWARGAGGGVVLSNLIADVGQCIGRHKRQDTEDIERNRYLHTFFIIL